MEWESSCGAGLPRSSEGGSVEGRVMGFSSEQRFISVFPGVICRVEEFELDGHYHGCLIQFNSARWASLEVLWLLKVTMTVLLSLDRAGNGHCERHGGLYFSRVARYGGCTTLETRHTTVCNIFSSVQHHNPGLFKPTVVPG